MARTILAIAAVYGGCRAGSPSNWMSRRTASSCLPPPISTTSSLSKRTIRRADQILAGLDFPAERRVGVQHAIEAHSYSAGIAPQTIEAKILQDADRMETLGAIGLARIFYVGGRIGTKLFHDTDPRALHRPLDDLSYSLDHFYTKILRLPDRMNTAPGRAIAGRRIEIIELFLQRLFEETGADEMSD
jgi:uncharacterized protein